MRSKKSRSSRIFNIGFILILWILTAWLLYPVVVLDRVEMTNAKAYLYRSALGIAIMIILLGKTIFDLLFPQVVTRNVPLLNTILLTIYSLAIATGIIFMVARMIILYLKNNDSGLLF